MFLKPLSEEIRAMCAGHPSAEIPWPHRELHRMADRALALEQAYLALQQIVDAGSIQRLVPSGYLLVRVELVDGLWEATICHRIEVRNTFIGTGPTPELAVADAAKKVKP